MAGLPHDVRAWACAFCHKLYPRDKRGKELAKSCCVCPGCNEHPSAYTGHGTLCHQCHARKELAAAEENLKWAEERLARARANKNGVV
jgi:hypothetical protein